MLVIPLVMKFIFKEVITISGKVQLQLLDEMILLYLKGDSSCMVGFGKNSLINSKGFSSYQLILERNVNLPTVLSDRFPALQGQTKSPTVAERLSSLHLARKAFIMNESTEKIRRALRKQIRQTGAGYTTGDEVYFQRSDNNKWKGPATVTGRDDPVVFKGTHLSYSVNKST